MLCHSATNDSLESFLCWLADYLTFKKIPQIKTLYPNKLFEICRNTDLKNFSNLAWNLIGIQNIFRSSDLSLMNQIKIFVFNALWKCFIHPCHCCIGDAAQNPLIFDDFSRKIFGKKTLIDCRTWDIAKWSLISIFESLHSRIDLNAV